MSSTSQDPIHLYIQMEEAEVVKQLRQENKELTELLAAERLRLNRIEMKYGDEVMLNSELVDLLKAHGIEFRPSLSHKFREGKT